MKTIEICPECGLEVAFDQGCRESALCPRCEQPIAARAVNSGMKVVLDPVNPAAGLNPIVLGPGVHTLGRMSAKSTATVKVDVQDFFMSKRHTQIMVNAHAGILVVKVRDAGSSNGTYINERRLGPVEEVDLHSGDTLRMGGTQFIVNFN